MTKNILQPRKFGKFTKCQSVNAPIQKLSASSTDETYKPPENLVKIIIQESVSQTATMASQGPKLHQALKEDPTMFHEPPSAFYPKTSECRKKIIAKRLKKPIEYKLTFKDTEKLFTKLLNYPKHLYYFTTENFKLLGIGSLLSCMMSKYFFQTDIVDNVIIKTSPLVSYVFENVSLQGIFALMPNVFQRTYAAVADNNTGFVGTIGGTFVIKKAYSFFKRLGEAVYKE